MCSGAQIVTDGDAASGAPPRLLVFGINYAPEPTGTALATTWLAESLTQRGWKVSVVTGIPHYPYWRAQRAPARAPDENVRVRHCRHYVPARQSAARRASYELSWVASALTEALRPRGVDLVLGIVPSLGGAVLAAAAATSHRVPFGLLFQDVLGRAAAQSGVTGSARIAGSVRRVELAFARRARRVAVVAEGFRSYFVNGGVEPSRVLRVRNPTLLEPARDDRDQVRAHLGWRPDEFVVLHSGSMGYKQGLENVARAAELARHDPTLRFVLQGDGNRRGELELTARRLALSNLTFAPLASAEEYPAILAAADVLLVNQSASVRNMSLPSKLGSYMAAGVPVIAAVSADDEVAAEIESSAAGVVVAPDDPRGLLAAIADLRTDSERAAKLGAAGKAYATRFLDDRKAIVTIEEFLVQCVQADGSSLSRFDPAGARRVFGRDR